MAGKIAYVEILVLIMVSWLFFVTSAARPEDWPMFRKDSLHSGFSSETTDTLKLSDTAMNELAWLFPTEGPILSSPVVWNHTVYCVSTDNYLYAVNDSTGRLVWKYPLGSWVESTPAVAQAMVYVGCMDHKLYAIDANHGEIKWTYETGSWIESSPVVGDGMVFIASTDHILYCIDALTGELKWKFQVTGDIYSSPAFYQGTIFFGCDNDTLYAVASNGQLRWKYGTGGYSIYASPSIANNLVIVGTVDNGIKYRKEHGEIRSVNNKIIALDADTGKIKWQYSTEPFGLMHSSPAVAYGMVYYVTDQGRVRALSLVSGSLVWEANLPDNSMVWASPAIAAGVIYIATYKGTVCLLSAQTGALLKTYSIFEDDVYFHSSPAIANNRLYLGGSNGKLYAVGKHPSQYDNNISESLDKIKNYSLSQNYPNPFNTTTAIRYHIAREGWVSLEVFNLAGQRVRTLVNERKPRGDYEAFWNGKNDAGEDVASGIYISRIRTKEFVQTRKVIFLK